MASSIAPEQILRELAEMWNTLQGPADSEHGAGVLRACSMTFIALVEESEDVAQFGETIAALMPEHPARTIVIRLRGAGERMLSERVYAQCWMPFGQNRQVCCEQVEIIASDSSLADLPSVVLPLAVADLPVILWCRSPRVMIMPEFRPIAAMARKVIFDSASFPDPTQALERVAEAIGTGTVIGDLAWTRLTRWREMVSQVFENRQNLARLSSLTDVTVRAAGEPPTSAWYLGAWVMDALADAGVRCAFHMTQADGAKEPGLQAVTLSGSDFECEISRYDGRLVVTVIGLATCTNLPKATDYILLREELRITAHDPIFEKTAASALRLAKRGSE